MFFLYIIILIVLAGTLIGKLETIDNEQYMKLGGDKILFWPPAGFKFSYYILSGQVFKTFKNEKILTKILSYLLFIDYWGTILWAIMK